MKRTLTALACALSMALCHAQQPPSGRVLPELTVRTADGLSTELSGLHAGANWVLIVLDASMPSALDFLSALNLKGQELDARVKILVLGEDEASERLKARMATMRGGIWLQAENPQAIRDLQLPGIPCMLGMHGANKVSWQFSGISNPPERMYHIANDWVQGASEPASAAQEGQSQ